MDALFVAILFGICLPLCWGLGKQYNTITRYFYNALPPTLVAMIWGWLEVGGGSV